MLSATRNGYFIKGTMIMCVVPDSAAHIQHPTLNQRPSMQYGFMTIDRTAVGAARGFHTDGPLNFGSSFRSRLLSRLDLEGGILDLVRVKGVMFKGRV